VNPCSLEKGVRLGYEQIKGVLTPREWLVIAGLYDMLMEKGKALDVETIEKMNTDSKETVSFVQVLLLQATSNCSARNEMNFHEDKKGGYSEASLIPIERRTSTINDSRMR
jgi:hypothetical protein